MKRIIILFLAVVLGVPLFSQGEKNDGFKRGFIKRTEIGYRFGFPTSYEYSSGYVEEYSALDLLKFNIIADYKLNTYFMMGLGIGFHGSLDEWGYIDIDDFFDPLYIPIFTDIRLTFPNNLISPYLSTGIGYNIKMNSHAKYSGSPLFDGVIYLNPNVGVSYKISKNLQLCIDIGYDLYRIPRVYFTDNSHGLNFNVGLSF